MYWWPYGTLGLAAWEELMVCTLHQDQHWRVNLRCLHVTWYSVGSKTRKDMCGIAESIKHFLPNYARYNIFPLQMYLLLYLSVFGWCVMYKNERCETCIDSVYFCRINYLIIHNTWHHLFIFLYSLLWMTHGHSLVNLLLTSHFQL